MLVVRSLVLSLLVVYSTAIGGGILPWLGQNNYPFGKPTAFDSFFFPSPFNKALPQQPLGGSPFLTNPSVLRGQQPNPFFGPPRVFPATQPNPFARNPIGSPAQPLFPRQQTVQRPPVQQQTVQRTPVQQQPANPFASFFGPSTSVPRTGAASAPANRFIAPPPPRQPQVGNVQGGIPCSRPVQYRVVNECQWTKANFPVQYPSSVKFTPFVGAAHTTGVSLFEPGKIASQAIVNVAETGDDAELQAFVQDCTNSQQCGNYLKFKCAPTGGQCTMQGTVNMNQQHRLLSMVSMLFPSPDWIVGVSNEDMCRNGSWLPALQKDLWVMDAGSDAGRSFESPDAPNARQPITTFDARDESNIFYDPNGVRGVGGVGGVLRPMCKLTIQLV